MTPVLMRRIAMGCVAGLVAALVGCSSKPEGPTAVMGSPEELQAGKGSRPSQAMVELSNAEVSTASPGVYRCRVQYRFTQGAPGDGPYTLELTLKNGGGAPVGEPAAKEFSGEQVKAQGGTLDMEANSGPGGATYSLRLMEGQPPQPGKAVAVRGRGPEYRQMSNVLTGNLR